VDDDTDSGARSGPQASDRSERPEGRRAALAPLLYRTQRRRRAAAEIALLVAVFLFPSTVWNGGAAAGWGQDSTGLLWMHAAAYVVLAVSGVWLVARGARGTVSSIAGSALLLLSLGTVAFAELELRQSLEQRTRLGVVPEDAPPGAEPAAVVRRVLVGTPADDALRTGDLIVAIQGEPLAADGPADDVRARAPNLPAGPVPFEVLRDGRRLTVTLVLEPISVTAYPFWMHALKAAALAVLIVVLIRSDGQTLRQLGLARDGAARELALGIPVLGALFVAHLAATVPIAMVARLFGAGPEGGERARMLSRLVSGVDAAELAVALVVAATFEEIAFRGFLLPRLRILTGHWSSALVLSAVVFGLGHLYEGTLGAVQASLLGVFFGLAFLWRGRLEAPIVAHAAFNAIMFALVIWLTQSGWLGLAGVEGSGHSPYGQPRCPSLPDGRPGTRRHAPPVALAEVPPPLAS
jgi:uncharacterized protein